MLGRELGSLRLKFRYASFAVIVETVKLRLTLGHLKLKLGVENTALNRDIAGRI